MSPDEIVPDFRVVQKGTMDKTNRIPSDLEMYRFDPASDLPLRLFYEDTSDTSFIRIVFSHLTFDMTSILLVLEDIQNFKIGSEISVPVSLPQDIAVQVNEHLREQETALEAYWKNSIPDNLLPLSFANYSDSYHFDEENVSSITDQVPRQLLTKLVQFCRSNETTPFQLMLTAYQMLLHLQIGVETVCVLTLADMRLHFPQFQREIGCLINKVPLFLTHTHDGTIDELLTENGKQIRARINSSLYPFDQIVKEVAARQVDPAAVFRHMINYRDFQKENTKEKNGYVNALNVVSPNHMHETVLGVWNDRNNVAMKLEFEYNTLSITKSKAEFLLQSLVKILEYLIDHTASTVKEMANMIEQSPTQSVVNSVTDEQHEVKSGEFIKQTRNGWNHPVQLSVCRSNEGDHTLLRWKKPNNKRSRHLNAEDIDSVDKAICNGLHTLLVRTTKRVYTFMTLNKRVCEGITDCLLNGLREMEQKI